MSGAIFGLGGFGIGATAFGKGGGAVLTRRVAFLGSSSVELQNSRPIGRMTNQKEGHLQFAKKINPRFEHLNKADASDPLGGGRGFSGDNWGVGGSSMFGIAGRVPVLLARGYKAVVLYSGNDPTNSSYTAQGIFDYIVSNIIDPLLAGGVQNILWLTVQPRQVQVDGSPTGGIPAGNAYWAKRMALNALMLAYNRPGVIVVDQTPALAVPGSPIEEAVAAHLADGLHLSALGASVAGRVVAPYYSDLFDSQIVYDASAAGNMAPNGTFAGTGGTAGLGASGQIVNGMRVSSTANTNYTLACSIVDRSGTRWQRVQGTPTLTDRKTITLAQQDTPSSSSATGIAVSGLSGRFVRGRAKLLLTDRPDALDFSVTAPGLRVEAKSASNGGVIETLWDYLPQFTSSDADGVLLMETPALLIPEGMTHLSMSLAISTSTMTGSLFGFETTGWELRECPDPAALF